MRRVQTTRIITLEAVQVCVFKAGDDNRDFILEFMMKRLTMSKVDYDGDDDDDDGIIGEKV